MRVRIYASTELYIDQQRKKFRRSLHAIYQEHLAATDALVPAPAENADDDADDLLGMLEAGQF